MPRYHFKHADGRWSNSKFSETVPTEVIETGGTWVLGEPEGEPYVEQDLNQKLDGVFKKLPRDVRARFAVIRTTIERHIELGDYDIAYDLVFAQAVPPELEETKQALLAILDQSV